MVENNYCKFCLSFLFLIIAKKADDNKEMFDGFNLSS